MVNGNIIRNLDEIRSLSSSDKDENIRFFRNYFLDSLFNLTNAFSQIYAQSLADEVYRNKDINNFYQKLKFSYNALDGIIESDKNHYYSFEKLKTFFEESKILFKSLNFLDVKGDKFDENYVIFGNIFKVYLCKFGFNTKKEVGIILEAMSNQVSFFSLKNNPEEEKKQVVENQNKIQDETFARLYESFIQELMNGSLTIADMDYEELTQLPNYARKQGDRFYARKMSIFILLKQFTEKFSQDQKRKETLILINNISQLFFNLFEPSKNKGPVDLYTNYKDFAQGLQLFCDKLSISNQYKRILSNFNGKIKFYAIYLSRKYNFVLK